MTRTPEPALTFEVDLTNPGQFLACCGLLELASRISGDAVAWFADSCFRLAHCPIDLVQQFVRAPVVTDGGDGAAPSGEGETEELGKSPPVRFASPFRLRLDWWTDASAVRAGFKTWAGGQTVIGFVDGMRKRIDADCDVGPGLFRQTVAIRQPKPLYFDARLSRLTAIDAGFSTERFTTAFSPATELLALVGLQRFRPMAVEPRERYTFMSWADPLPVAVAAAVAHGLVPCLASQRYQFPLVVRTGGKYKAFGTATPDRSTHANV